MQPVSPRIVDHLNEALVFELTVTNVYFLHARLLDAWGLPKLGKVFYDLSIGEMRDADALIQRIIFFDAVPKVQLDGVAIGSSPEQILTLALDSEKKAVAQFNAAAGDCHQLGDHATASIFEEMARDEEQHADWLEGQLDAIERVGVPNYLAQQLDPGQGPA